MDLVDTAEACGWTTRAACGYLELSQRRLQRWRRRVAEGESLDDAAPGGNPSHGLTPDEEDEIVAVFNEWGDIDRSHRKLAHRGSWLGRFWADPSTVRRVLERRDLRFRAPKRQVRSQRRPWPHWVEEVPNRIWIYDTTHWSAATAATTVISDVVSRKWIADVTSKDETSVEVQAVFSRALRAEGLDEVIDERNPDAVAWNPDTDQVPVLSVMSDNGPQTGSGSTREPMALCRLATHYGRPATPTDQAWIESLFGHLKTQQPHLKLIADIDVLRTELDIQRTHYNTVRLHAGIGYVTPDQEHRGEGPTVRAARRNGLTRTRQQRITYHPNHQTRKPDHAG
ncbi:integrase core domain-containing protein [Candidatus Poriferisocius sp.]|uniref:integrase core domain-containing protein n=1 Tax=Candidatus Poriferisocius sp. TaxID=3101276 RepID=UPI003B5A684A